MTKKMIVLMMLIAGGGFAMLIQQATHLPVLASPHVAEIDDNSGSQKIDCDSVGQTTTAAVKSIRPGKKSTLLLLTLGSPAESFEPRLVLDIPIGKGGVLKRSGANVEDRVTRACTAYSHVPSSSIFRAVQIALEMLRNRGCTPDVPCVLVVRTDLDESYAPQIVRGGNGSAPLLNAGIRTEFCGYAVTQGGGGPRGEYVDMLIRRWRAAFEDPSPEALTFSPFCAGQKSAAGA